ncbi:MAG: hypothetical protein ACRENK_15690 [Gemmatimonadaceae bacterium]
MTDTERLDRIEASVLRVTDLVISLMDSIQSLHGAMCMLGAFIGTQAEMLPGELPIDLPKPN